VDEQIQSYVLNQKIMSFSGDSWIEDGEGNRVFEVDGQAFSLRRTLDLMDRDGRTLYRISASLAHLRPTFEIKRGDELVATISKAMLTFFGDRFTIDLAGGDELEISGNFLGREFHVTRGGADVIVASRALLNIRDSYSVSVAPGFEPALALAIVVALEQMELEERKRH
jgi:uncharacterized protein YxjI